MGYVPSSPSAADLPSQEPAASGSTSSAPPPTEAASVAAEALRTGRAYPGPACRGWSWCQRRRPPPPTEAPTNRFPAQPQDLFEGFRIYVIWSCPGASGLPGIWYGPDQTAWSGVLAKLPTGVYSTSGVALRRYYSWADAVRGWWSEGPRPRPTLHPSGRAL